MLPFWWSPKHPYHIAILPWVLHPPFPGLWLGGKLLIFPPLNSFSKSHFFWGGGNYVFSKSSWVAVWKSKQTGSMLSHNNVIYAQIVSSISIPNKELFENFIPARTWYVQNSTAESKPLCHLSASWIHRAGWCREGRRGLHSWCSHICIYVYKHGVIYESHIYAPKVYLRLCPCIKSCSWISKSFICI